MSEIPTELRTLPVTFLHSGDHELSLPLLFGELVKLAQPIVEHYHSDLWHDAAWIREHIPTSMAVGGAYAFVYGVRDTGTSIGEDLGLTLPYNSDVWSITVHYRSLRHGVSVCPIKRAGTIVVADIAEWHDYHGQALKVCQPGDLVGKP